MKKILPFFFLVIILLSSCGQGSDYLCIRNDSSIALHINTVVSTRTTEIGQDINAGEELSLRRSALFESGSRPESLLINFDMDLETYTIDTGYIQDETALLLCIGPGRFYSLYGGDGGAISENKAF